MRGAKKTGKADAFLPLSLLRSPAPAAPLRQSQPGSSAQAVPSTPAQPQRRPAPASQRNATRLQPSPPGPVDCPCQRPGSKPGAVPGRVARACQAGEQAGKGGASTAKGDKEKGAAGPTRTHIPAFPPPRHTHTVPEAPSGPRRDPLLRQPPPPPPAAPRLPEGGGRRLDSHTYHRCCCCRCRRHLPSAALALRRREQPRLARGGAWRRRRRGVLAERDAPSAMSNSTSVWEAARNSALFSGVEFIRQQQQGSSRRCLLQQKRRGRGRELPKPADT